MDTIAAISTALGAGAISIVRLSGDEAIDIVNKCFVGKDLNKVESHTITYGHIVEDGKTIDEVLVSVFKAPKTYTRENVVEINCHGGMYVTNRILEIMLNNGARIAESGEFTKRAFLNGRIDLTRAEAVMDVINSQTENALALANGGLRGDVYNMVQGLRKELIDCIAKIEVNIDYPEYEEENYISNEILKPTLSNIKNKLEKILERAQSSLMLKDGIDTAIIGKPNVGKSSILNALTREKKAIVTDVAGTTRDIVEGKITIGGVVLNLIDTAGVRETEDIVEKIGIDKAKEALEKAKLVLLVLDGSRPFEEEDKKLLELTENKERLIILNKSDLPLINEAKDKADIIITSSDDNDIVNLEEAIKKVCNIKEINNVDATYVGNARQLSKMKEALKAVKEALNSIDFGLPIDIVNIDISNAWNSLGEIIGKVSSDDLLDTLFSNFCLGK